MLVHRLFGWAAQDGIRAWVAQLPFAAALLLIVLAADLVQYAIHRAYHEAPLLWRLHAVHHSAKTMDWLAGSRQHVVEVILTRTLVLGVIFVLAFGKSVIDAYILIVGFQAVFNHANVSVPTTGWLFGPLSRLLVTPNFHHWHHAQDDEAIDRNFAAHFAFISASGASRHGVRAVSNLSPAASAPHGVSATQQVSMSSGARREAAGEPTAAAFRPVGPPAGRASIHRRARRAGRGSACRVRRW